MMSGGQRSMTGWVAVSLIAMTLQPESRPRQTIDEAKLPAEALAQLVR